MGLCEIDEGGLWKGSISLYAALFEEPGRGGDNLLGTLKDTERKALETGISLHRDPVGESGGGLIYQGL